MSARGRLPIEECIDENKPMEKLEGMPRDLDTFWFPDDTLPRSMVSGHKMLKSGSLNKCTGFPHRERQLLGIHGLIPPAVHTVEQQLQACEKLFQTLTSELQKVIFMLDLEYSNRKLFYRLMMRDPMKYLSLFYCSEKNFLVKNYSQMHTTMRGMFITIKDRGHIRQVLQNWPHITKTRILLLTTGSAVLNWGDQGVHGTTAIFYRQYHNVVFAGINPEHQMPLSLDVGTDNVHLLNDRSYLGVRQPRPTREEFFDFFEELMLAILRALGPRAIVQCCDFNTYNALYLLKLYRQRQCFMNIDMQCKGACGLAALLGSLKITKQSFKDFNMLFYGMDAFSIGMARLCISYLKTLDVDDTTAKSKIWFFNEGRLVVHNPCKQDCPEQLLEFMRFHKPIKGLAKAVSILRPNVLIGSCLQANVFDKEVLVALEKVAEHPIIFSMTRPVEQSECNANDAFVYTKGRCIFITGCRLPPLKYANVTYQPAYCSSQYMLGGFTQGVMLSGMTTIPDTVFLVAAQRLCSLIWPTDLAQRNVYPPMRKLKCINLQIAEAVFSYALRRGLSTLRTEPQNPLTYITEHIYNTDYTESVPEVYCTTDVQIGTTESQKYYKEHFNI